MNCARKKIIEKILKKVLTNANSRAIIKVQKRDTKEVTKMNAEIIKAMNKKETKRDEFRKWWSKNGYKVMRVVLFPLWWGIQAKEKITSYLDSREEWSEEKVKEILNY